MVGVILLWILIVFSPSWAMGDELFGDSDSNDSGSVVSLDEFPPFTNEDLEPLDMFKERHKRRMEEALQRYRAALPGFLKKGLPELEPFNEEDYVGLIDDEGQPIDPQEALEEFKGKRSEAPKYQALQKALEKKKEARLARQTELAAQQPNGHHGEIEEEGDGSASSSTDEEGVPTSIDWDAVVEITKRAKQNPDPIDWLSHIDWSSLENSSAVSPSKGSTITPSIELLRRANWRNLSTLPHYGWNFKERRELDVGGKCDLCNHSLRYGYVLSHPESGKEVCVGRVCSEHLRKDPGVIERERQGRLSSGASLNPLIAAIQFLSVE